VLWAPLNTDPNYRVRDEHGLLVFARLRTTVTVEQAQHVMDGIARDLYTEFPASRGWNITVIPLQRFYSSIRSIRLALLALGAAVAFLLTIACANLSNLLLARSRVRANETVVRMALGATRGRVIRQLVVESMVLGSVGGVSGFLLARVTFGSLMAWAPVLPSFRPHALGLNYGTFAFAMTISVAASIAFGIVPAFRASPSAPALRLREAGRGAHGNRTDRVLRRLLVGGELAITVVLLAAAGLLLTTLRNLQSDRLGFGTAGIVTALVGSLDESHYRTESDTSTFYRQLFEQLRSTPGVESVTGAGSLPLRGLQGPGSPFEVHESLLSRPGQLPAADLLIVEPTYFKTLGINVVEGRGFEDQDDERHPTVAVINQSLARRLWPGQTPIGREVRPLDPIAGGRWYRIVGVVADSKERGVGTQPQPTIYRSYYQSVARFVFLLVRVRPFASTVALRNAVASVNHGLPVNDFQSLDAEIAASVATQRFSALLMGVFAGLGFVLACMGVYGVTSYSVAERTREIGLRIALGAAPRDIRRLILRETFTVAIIGLGVGVLVAAAVARYFHGLLYEVAPADPFALISPALLLLVVTILSAGIPTWRAMRVSPLLALRGE
jgi:putative ABC transport system permease protein